MATHNTPDLFDWKSSLLSSRVRSCSSNRCRRQILHVRNIDTKREGVLAWTSAIYVMRRPPVELADLPPVRILQRFMQDVVEFRMRDGSTINPADLRFFTNHYDTCQDLPHFTKQKHKAPAPPLDPAAPAEPKGAHSENSSSTSSITET